MTKYILWLVGKSPPIVEKFKILAPSPGLLPSAIPQTLAHWRKEKLKFGVTCFGLPAPGSDGVKRFGSSLLEN